MTGTGPMRLHEAQINVPDALVASLIATQCPQWAHLPLRRLDHDGTIHRVDLLGDDMVVRVPFIDWAGDEAGDDLARQDALVAALAPVGVAVPRVLFRGEPAPGMPWHWGVYERLPGRTPRLGDDADSAALARDLAAVLHTLRAMPPVGAPAPAAFSPRSDNAVTRPHVEALDHPAALKAWTAAVEQPAWDEGASAAVWVHGDLVRGNILLADSQAGPRATGVIDWGASGVGDPALDLLPAWTCMGPAARADFLAAVEATEAQTLRARAYAVRKAAWGIPYYEQTLPAFAEAMRFTLMQVAADLL